MLDDHKVYGKRLGVEGFHNFKYNDQDGSHQEDITVKT